VGTEQLRNIDAFADAYLETDDPHSLGVILTNWIPSRYIQNSAWDGFAYGSVAFNQGSGVARTSGFRRFVEKHYQAEWNEMWDEAFHLLYDSTPARKGKGTTPWMGLSFVIPWSNEDQLVAVLKDTSPRPNPFIRIRSLLVQLEPLVMKNLSDFQAFELCVEYLERAFWREAILIEQVNRKNLQQDTVGLLASSIAQRDQELLDALTKDWDSGRFPNAPAKLEPVYDLQPKDQLLFQWRRAAAYSTSLAKDPKQLYQLLKKA
jgi:hypothetical protein